MTASQNIVIRITPEVDLKAFEEAASRLDQIQRRAKGLRPSRFPRSPIRKARK